MENMNRLIREGIQDGMRVKYTQLYETNLFNVGVGAGRQSVSVMIKSPV